MKILPNPCRMVLAGFGVFLLFSLTSPAVQAAESTFSQNEVMQAAENFFGVATKGLAEVVQRVFDDPGEPNAFITAEEASGAIGIGLRYGRGELTMKGRGQYRLSPLHRQEILASVLRPPPRP